MPVFTSRYVAPWWLKNPHVATILPSVFRKVDIQYERERFNTRDGDFLDLDWLRGGNKRLVVLSHGLEGSSSRAYVAGTARYHSSGGFDVLAWNCRSCSGEMNRLPRLYHHADSSDLEEIIDYVSPMYNEIYLVGYSMGGNITLNYLSLNIHPENVMASVVFSVPVDLKNSVEALTKRANSFYRKRFLRKLQTKMKQKEELFPEVINTRGIEQITSFAAFDNRFTAPLHGFRDADDFYMQGSPGPKLKHIALPVLIVNACNDPFLGTRCYPEDECRNSGNLFLEMPADGGHVGFPIDRQLNSYMDYRPLQFFDQLKDQ